jgi:citrate synthase
VYAYVSRGLLGSRPAGDRRNEFSAADVERLAARGRRGGVRRSSMTIDVPVESRITHLDPAGRLSYRGVDVRDLAGRVTFEQSAELLWTGAIPERTAWGQPDRAGRHGGRPLAWMPEVVAEAARRNPLRGDLEPSAIESAARATIGAVAGDVPIARGVTELMGLRPSWRRVVETALVLLADHELATSTLAVRLGASTRADPYACAQAGLAVLSGPLHGGAAPQAAELLRRAIDLGAAAAVEDALARTGFVPGFGHRVYRAEDPRATVLLDALRARHGGVRLWRAVDEVCRLVSDHRPLHPNVDLALGALIVRTGATPESSELIFATARLAGWFAHAIEEYAERPLRFRVRALYVP